MSKKNVFVFFSVFLLMSFLFFSATQLYAAEDSDLYLAQGIKKLNEGKYAEALDILKKALQLSPDNPEVQYYTAVAYSRRGELAQAEKLFLTILKKDESAASAHFELGRLYTAQGSCNQAENHLRKFMVSSDDKSAISYADDLIKRCYASAEGEAEKPVKLNISLGYQYDTNVVLEATNPPVTIGKKRDGRGIALLSAGVIPFQKGIMKLKLDYNFYQSVHLELTDFNVDYHNLSPNLELNFPNGATLSGGYRLEYIYFGGDIYGVIHTYFAKVKFKESKYYSTDAIYEYRDNKYWNTEIFSTNSDRTGYQTTGGIQQNFNRGSIKGDIHYFYDDNRAKREFWGYIGHKIGASLGYRIIDPLLIRATAEYNRRKHKHEFPPFGETRLDKMQKYELDLQYSLSPRIAVTLTESYTVNDSNLRDFDYTRNIIGVLVTVGVI